MTSRPDLAALTDDALALVANRGLVKRAARMFAEETPELLVTSERILVRYGDGVETSLPAGVPFSEASCTCGASSVCRHRVGLVLVYRANHGSSFDHIDWTPGEFDDEALEAFLGAAGTGTGESDQAGGLPGNSASSSRYRSCCASRTPALHGPVLGPT